MNKKGVIVPYQLSHDAHSHFFFWKYIKFRKYPPFYFFFSFYNYITLMPSTTSARSIGASATLVLVAGMLISGMSL